MTKRIFPIILLCATQIYPSSQAISAETAAPKALIAQPLIADNQGKRKNTYQNCFRVKVPAKDLIFPLAQTAKELGIGVTIIDTAALFENKQTNSLWKPTAEGLPMTDAGVHPNEVDTK